MNTSTLAPNATVATATAGPLAAQAAPTPVPVVRPDAEQWDVTSQITGRTYRISVAKPAGDEAPAKSYPVVYFTDGDITFHTAADAIIMLEKGREVRPAIVVAVGYGRGVDAATLARFTDLTPFPPGPAIAAALETAEITKGVTYGEAEGFHRFLTEELRPLIDALYNTDKTENILWGHSLGGLFALHVLFNHPQAYRAYLIGTPSIVWNDIILTEEKKLAAPVAAGEVAPRVLFMVGGLEEHVPEDAKLPPGITREQLQEMQKAAGAITNVVAMAGRLKALEGSPGCTVETVIFDSETHISVIPSLISRGLRFALEP